MEHSTNSPCCFDSYYYNYKGPKIVIETKDPLDLPEIPIIFFEKIENKEYTIVQAKKTYEVFLKSITEEEAEEIFPLEGRVEEFKDIDLEGKTIEQVKEELEKKGYIKGALEKISGALGSVAIFSGLGSLGTRAALLVSSWSGPVATSTTGIFFEFFKLKAKDEAAKSLLGFSLAGISAANAANILGGVSLLSLGLKGGELVYNNLIASTPEEKIEVDLKKSVTNFCSQLGFSQSKTKKIEDKK